MVWFIAGLLVGVVAGAAGVRYRDRVVEARRPKEDIPTAREMKMVEEMLGGEADIQAAYEADLLRQMRNMLRYDGTEKGQVERE